MLFGIRAPHSIQIQLASSLIIMNKAKLVHHIYRNRIAEILQFICNNSS